LPRHETFLLSLFFGQATSEAIIARKFSRLPQPSCLAAFELHLFPPPIEALVKEGKIPFDWQTRRQTELSLLDARHKD
jgi:hypothetical protein